MSEQRKFSRRRLRAKVPTKNGAMAKAWRKMQIKKYGFMDWFRRTSFKMEDVV